jgi:hypothetical protein
MPGSRDRTIGTEKEIVGQSHRMPERNDVLA